MPAAIPAAPPAADGASTIDLLNDQQTRLTNDGDSSYFDIAYKIASPQGLDDAALQVGWDPSLETLTLHKYRIIRDGQTMDLLGDGSKLSVIQRETNMESAALDGELTATMQPSDVRVGDIVELAFTRTRRDPALGGRSEDLVGPNDGTPYGRMRVRFIWPDSKKLKWHAFDGVLHPKLVHSAGGNDLTADVSDVTTPIAPNSAPGRYSMVNAVEVSEFPDWGAVSQAMLPLYTAAARLGENSPVRAEAKRIAAATTDPKRRAEMALALVQDQVRYLFLGMNDGGYVPAAADLTWTRRFGDCKAKAVLLTALLSELGIEAEPVLVNTANGDLTANRLPAMGAFDHVIVRARIAGHTYWLDGTELGDSNISWLRTPPYVVGLPIAAGTKALLPLTPEPLTDPSETVSLALDASAGIDAPAPAIGEMRFRGASANQMRMKYTGLSSSDRDKELRDLWRKNYDFVSPSQINTAVDQSSGDFIITMNGTAKMDWYTEAGTRWYEVDRARVGWKFDTDRDGAVDKDAPFVVDYPDYWESRETIKLPADGKGFALQGGSVDQTVGGVYAFHRKVGIENGVMTMESSTRALAPELPASKAEQTRQEMAALANDGVFVRVPGDYMATAADIAALQGDKKALAAALLQRGAVHFDRQEIDASIADENGVLAIDPDNAGAHSVRALALASRGDPKADQDADRALALDAKQVLAWRAKGLVAIAQKRYADAEADFSHQLAINPKDADALLGRASSRLLLRHFADALSDTDASLAVTPTLQGTLIRATALAALGREEEALTEASRAVDAHPDSQAVRKIRAELRASFGERDLAIEDYDTLIKQAPKVDYYLRRAALWPIVDEAKQNADIAAALALDPHSAKALAARASIEIRNSRFADAQNDIGTLEHNDADGELVYEMKLQLLEKQGRKEESLKLVDSYLAKHPGDATVLNERCWTKATLDVQIDTAIADCDQSLKLSPDNPATLDSRGFTKLRLGQIDGAIADYDAALKLVPELPDSLYGRAIALARKGQAAAARADLAEARKISPDIDARFATFGMALPAILAAAAPAAPQAQPK